jgi:23S rRNA (guanosine2251-2'-O)-methyltransferase
VEHVPVESCHFPSQLEWFKEQGYWVYGLKEGGDVLLPKQNANSKAVLVVGSEGTGLRSSTEKFCDQFITIPQVESGSSYNASVAFAMSAYEMTRSRYL